MKYIFAIPFALLCVVGGCKSSLSDDCHAQLNENCICTKQYDPVCGCNNVTYGNACEAQCNGIENFTSGECTNTTGSD
jgi:hypothetical protein